MNPAGARVDPKMEDHHVRRFIVSVRRSPSLRLQLEVALPTLGTSQMHIKR
jgi:hypothetical protein